MTADRATAGLTGLTAAECGRRALAAALIGIVVYVAVRWDPTLIALVASLYTVAEAGFLQARQARGGLLPAWANLPVGDDRVFDLIARVTVRHALIVLGFGAGYFASVALDAGLPLVLALLAGLGTATLLWALVLSTVAVLLAALPGVPLSAVAVLGGLMTLLSLHAGDSGLMQLALHLPAGWVVRIFAAVTLEPADVWPLVAMCVVLLVLGRVNLSLLRARYQLPELTWREVPAEQVLEMLVREEADELVEAGVQPEPAEGPLPAGLRARAERNVERTLREVIASGGWRRVPRPLGTAERFLWLVLPDDQQRIAQFVVPMGRSLTEGLKRAVVVCLMGVLAAWSGMSIFTQALAFVAVAFLCAWPGRSAAVSPGRICGLLPIEPMGLMWIALEVAAMRVAFWVPMLLVQARVLQGVYGVAHAVPIALRLAVLVLALQPFVVAMRVGGVDTDVHDYGWGSGTLLGALALPLVVLSMVAVLQIVAEPLLTEGPALAVVAVLSLAVFVLHGLRQSTVETF